MEYLLEGNSDFFFCFCFLYLTKESITVYEEEVKSDLQK
jgi:hypothetical protein